MDFGWRQKLFSWILVCHTGGHIPTAIGFIGFPELGFNSLCKAK